MINLKQEHYKVLLDIFNSYCPKAQIWMYGSRIKDVSHSGSDLDLTVKSFNEDCKYLSELKELLNNSNIPFLIDINEFENLPESFQAEIEKNYVEIYPKNIFGNDFGGQNDL